MSWVAYLHGMDADGELHDVYQKNYTHNCNVMANDALRTGPPFWSPHVLTRRPSGSWGSWWDELNGMSGRQAMVFLERIITVMESDPDRYRKMNPQNLWGDYDQFLGILKEMQSKSVEYPSATWSTSG